MRRRGTIFSEKRRKERLSYANTKRLSCTRQNCFASRRRAEKIGIAVMPDTTATWFLVVSRWLAATVPPRVENSCLRVDHQDRHSSIASGQTCRSPETCSEPVTVRLSFDTSTSAKDSGDSVGGQSRGGKLLRV